jgi:predicted GNAT family N-acyltransferase
MSFSIVTTLSQGQVADLMRLYGHTYWASERERDDVERMLASSDYLFGVVEAESGRLRAFARVLTDGVFRAVIFDVVVDPEFRGYGLTRMIFEAMLAHPELSKVENLLLFCKEDVVGLYGKFGFSEECDGMRLMRRHRSP